VVRRWRTGRFRVYGVVMCNIVVARLGGRTGKATAVIGQESGDVQRVCEGSRRTGDTA